MAAGLGERLRPITNHIPKPLMPILGKPILLKVLERVLVLPHAKVGINVHYKGEMIRDWVSKSGYSDKITLFHEEEVLGTGGGLINAESFLKNCDFLVHNADIVSDINLTELVDRHRASGNTVTLAVHDYERFNNVWIDEKGLIRAVGKEMPSGNGGLRNLAFTGIAVYSPSFLSFLPGGNSSVVDAWIKAAGRGHRVGSLNVTGAQWTDIGNAQAYFQAVLQELKKEGEILYIGGRTEVGDSDIGPYTVVEEGAAIEKNACINNSVLLAGGRVSRGSRVENAIIGPDFIVHVDASSEVERPLESACLVSNRLNDETTKLNATIIGAGGSDRIYFRLKEKDKSVVLMECPATDQDYERQLAYTRFFESCNIPVPRLLDYETYEKVSDISPDQKVHAIFEDLGDISLYSWLKFVNDKHRIEEAYRRVLDILIRLHSVASIRLHECPRLESRLFDYDHLRWETSYFMERFVVGLMGICIEDKDGLDSEFSRLAGKVHRFEKCIVHRDYQSQNIMVTSGDIPRVIDYQGARIGPQAYDVASILWDPYYEIRQDMRDRLLDYYLSQMKLQKSRGFNEMRFRQTIIYCRLQRHMQALGAYGFLSTVRGKKYFLKYIPRALRYLREETELVKTEYPLMHALVRRISEQNFSTDTNRLNQV